MTPIVVYCGVGAFSYGNNNTSGPLIPGYTTLHNITGLAPLRQRVLTSSLSHPESNFVLVINHNTVITC